MYQRIILLAALLFCASCDEKTTTNHCGDGVVDTGEECDGVVDPVMSTCQSEGFYGGVLTCTSDCSFDTSDCASQGFCGDDVIQFNYEQCESGDLNGSSCEALGYHLGGDLGCNASCRFDTSSCIGDPVCGNDVIEGSEQCDGEFFNTTCAELGFVSGELGCTDNCALDDSGCSNCGNNFIDEDEECEGINLNGHSCMEMGYWQGELQCDDTCHFAPCEEFTQLASGGYHTCGLTNFGYLYCWGPNNYGQLGIGTTTASLIPSRVPHPTGGVFTEVACGMEMTCALDDQDQFWCWGRQTLDGTIVMNATAPEARELPEGVLLHQLTMAQYHVCGLDQAGAAWCMGAGDNDRLGTGDASSTATFEPVVMPAGTSFAQMDCGYSGCCAVDVAGEGWCWGSNAFGESGTGTADTISATPVRVLMPPGAQFESIRRYHHVCALDVTGVAFCWGSNAFGRLGIGDSAPSASATPLQVLSPVGVSFSQVELTQNAACALSTGGDAYCWGGGSFWEQGDDSAGDDPAPTSVTMPAGSSFTAVTGGNKHLCALDLNGYPHCWGNGTQGEMGDAAATENRVPSKIARSE